MMLFSFTSLALHCMATYSKDFVTSFVIGNNNILR